MAGNADEIPLSLSDDELDVAPEPLASASAAAADARMEDDGGDKEDNANHDPDDEEDDAAMRAAMGFAAFGATPHGQDAVAGKGSSHNSSNNNNNKRKRERESGGRGGIGSVTSNSSNVGNESGGARGADQPQPAVGSEQQSSSGNPTQISHAQRGQALFKPSFIEDPWQGLTPKRFADIPRFQQL